MKKCVLSYLIALLLITTQIAFAQDVRTLYEKVRQEYESGNFATVVNLCRQIIERCEQNYPDA